MEHPTGMEQLTQQLLEALAATHVAIVDNSAQHAGHAGIAADAPLVGTHLHITIVSPRFEAVDLLDRHRMVHDVLQTAFATHLHALELKPYTPTEWLSCREAT